MEQKQVIGPFFPPPASGVVPRPKPQPKRASLHKHARFECGIKPGERRTVLAPAGVAFPLFYA